MSHKNKAANQTDKILQESHWLALSTLLFITASISGLIMALPFFEFSNWHQFNILGHTFIGSFAFLPLCIYTFIHFKRTLGSRNPLLIFTGLLVSIILFILFSSGFWIALEGQSESTTWITISHRISAFIVLGLISLHLLTHIHSKMQKKRETKKNNAIFITVKKTLFVQILLTTVIYISSIVLLSFIYSTIYSTIENSDAPAEKNDYLYNYGDHPFRPSQTETVSNGFIKTAQIAKSQQCGSCHTEIYQQWLSSTHRQAASDPSYVKNVSLLDKKRGIAATRYCEGCHAPVALLTGELTPGGKHGGIAGTPANMEGVGCLACHGISKVVHLNGTASYEFDPKEHYLFSSSTQLIPQKIRDFLIRLKPNQHKKAMGSDLIEDPKLCASCHEQFMDKSMNDWGWVKMQSSYTQWLSSPFSGQNEQDFQSETSLNCQNCHFPLVKGNDPSADKNGFIHSHRSLGANTVLPLLNGDKEQLEATIKFLQSAKILVDIEEPHRKDNLQNHQFIKRELRPSDHNNTPFFLYLAENATLRVSVTNRMVGHTFPTGTTDINQAWLYFKVSDADNQTVYESGFLNEDLELDKNAHIYHSIPVDREGREVWKHDLFRMVGNAYKNVIPSGKTDIKEYSFTVPSWAKEPLTATAIVKYRKFNQRYARWALDHPKPVLPIVDMARDSLTIPLKLKPVIQ